jgi:tRNA 2-thiouridine synthesizing protein B
MLHLIYQSPLETATLQRLGETDSVLFLENALFNLLKKSRFEILVKETLRQQSLFVLEDEIRLRGIDEKELIEGIMVINYQGFVHLTLKHPLIQTWN